MRIIYIDNDFKCYTYNDGTLREIETDFFDGKCRRFIEGYRFIPEGETWTRDDGTVFASEMVAPWRDYSLLAEFQAQYEETQAQIAELEAANADQSAALAAIYSGVSE